MQYLVDVGFRPNHVTHDVFDKFKDFGHDVDFIKPSS